MGILSRSLSIPLIAVAIRSVDRTLQEINPKGWCAVRTLHIAIALAIHSLEGISIALLNQSVDRTLQTVLFKQVLRMCPHRN